MVTIAKTFLQDRKRAAETWNMNDSATALVRYMYENAPKGYRVRFRQIWKQDIGTLSLDDVMVYLAAVVFSDRICDGNLDRQIRNGTVDRLLERYLVLQGENAYEP